MGGEWPAEEGANLRVEGRVSDGEKGDEGGIRERGSASFIRPHSRWVSGPTAPRLRPITTAGPSHPAHFVRN